VKKPLALCAVAVFIAMAAGCGQQQPPDTHDADVKAIADGENQMGADYAAKDADKVASHFADDVVAMYAGQPAIRGKEALRTSGKQAFADPGFAITTQRSVIEVAKSGDLAYVQGTYQISGTNPATKQVEHDHGYYVTVYRKMADGSWKAVSDIATSEVPPPTPPPASKGKH